MNKYPELQWVEANADDSKLFDLGEYQTIVEWHGDSGTVFTRAIGPTLAIKLPPLPQNGGDK